MPIINDSFMLRGKSAEQLYHDHAEQLPIIDYHCHLSPKQIAENKNFSGTHELFLGGDHYKWRQMRSCGIDERLITGDADPYDKWEAFAGIMPLLIGNPLYHWTALELKRYFDVDIPLCAATAREIYEHCDGLLARPDFSPRALIERSNVEVLCTTDDPADDLAYHKQLALDRFEARVLPTFRPDRLLAIEKPDFVDYLSANGLDSYDAVVSWLSKRADYFNSIGCRLSDQAFEYVPYTIGHPRHILEKRLAGKWLTHEEIDAYKTALLTECAKKYSSLGWTMQLHLGVIRNNNRRMFEALGPDTGFDSVSDRNIAAPLAKMLSSLDYKGILPKTILYNLDPSDNHILGTMIGNFQSAPTPGKLQLGSGWWFCDNRDGMEAQLRTLGNLGALGTFVGMLTDSRSFVSYPRHEYFRRILCNLIGGWVDAGEYPNDPEALKMLVEGISYRNAKEYFKF